MAEGYWPPIRDRESAVGAVRMAGLPVFLVGAGTVLTVAFSAFAVVVSGQRIVNPIEVIIAAAIGAALVLLGLMLRNGRAALVPLAVFFTVSNALATFWFAPWWASIVQVLMMLLALSGLRGWWWLRKQGG